MLFVLIPTIWLAVNVVIVALCRVAADGDTANRRSAVAERPPTAKRLHPAPERLSTALNA